MKQDKVSELLIQAGLSSQIRTMCATNGANKEEAAKQGINIYSMDGRQRMVEALKTSARLAMQAMFTDSANYKKHSSLSKSGTAETTTYFDYTSAVGNGVHKLNDDELQELKTLLGILQSAAEQAQLERNNARGL